MDTHHQIRGTLPGFHRNTNNVHFSPVIHRKLCDLYRANYDIFIASYYIPEILIPLYQIFLSVLITVFLQYFLRTYLSTFVRGVRPPPPSLYPATNYLRYFMREPGKP